MEDNPRMSWCPGTHCESVVECVADVALGEALDVFCSCGTIFCFNCHEEAHR